MVARPGTTARHRAYTADVADRRPLSAIPPVAARAIAFTVILLGGLAGGTIGYALVTIDCDGDCGLAAGIGILVGAVVCAAGLAVVAVLALRAMGEWHEIEDRARAGHAPG